MKAKKYEFGRLLQIESLGIASSIFSTDWIN
jgi:hypothetical protein